jgi:hypothetical protein
MFVVSPSAASTQHRAGPASTVVVCLRADSDLRQLPKLAAAALHRCGTTPQGRQLHFVAGTRRSRLLLERRHGMTCGGPIRLLDLDATRRHGGNAAAAQWQTWRHVVASTRPAQSFRHFTDRCHDDPDGYCLERARADYLAQPRVIAMSVHNAMPRRRCTLPAGALEAFQAGYGTYSRLGWLAAVPADGLLRLDGDQLSTAASVHLVDQVAYLQAANTYLDALPPDVYLIASTVAV